MNCVSEQPARLHFLFCVELACYPIFRQGEATAAAGLRWVGVEDIRTVASSDLELCIELSDKHGVPLAQR